MREHRVGHERVAEHALAREAGDDLADDAHAGQDHDVDGRVRVEPEQVLEQQRIAAQGRVEDAEAEDALGHDEQQRHRQHGRRQHEDEARGIERPDEQRQAEPGQARGAQRVDGDDEIEAGQRSSEKPAMKTPIAASDDMLLE